MIQLLKKEDQFNRTIFNGNFIANKPVANGVQDNVNLIPVCFIGVTREQLTNVSLDCIRTKGLK
jgi:hypothetical protein